MPLKCGKLPLKLLSEVAYIPAHPMSKTKYQVVWRLHRRDSRWKLAPCDWIEISGAIKVHQIEAMYYTAHPLYCLMHHIPYTSYSPHTIFPMDEMVPPISNKAHATSMHHISHALHFPCIILSTHHIPHTSYSWIWCMENMMYRWSAVTFLHF